MAIREQREVFTHAMIDCSDGTLTEYDTNGARSYSIAEILKRWEGISDIRVEIRRSEDLPEKRGEDIGES